MRWSITSPPCPPISGSRGSISGRMPRAASRSRSHATKWRPAPVASVAVLWGKVEVIAAVGMAGVFTTSPAVTPTMIARPTALNAAASGLRVAVDNPANVDSMAAAAPGGRKNRSASSSNLESVERAQRPPTEPRRVRTKHPTLAWAALVQMNRQEAHARYRLFYFAASTAFQMAGALLSLRRNLSRLNCPL